jgi:hypothetical protein
MPSSGKAKLSTKEHIPRTRLVLIVKSVQWDVRGIHWVEGWNMVGKVREEDGERGSSTPDGSPFREAST